MHNMHYTHEYLIEMYFYQIFEIINSKRTARMFDM